MKNILIPIVLLLAFVSCKKNQDITMFNIEDRYINFSITDTMINSQINYTKEASYSFAFEKENVKTKKYGIPVALIGQILQSPLQYEIEVDQEKTTLPKEAYAFEEFTFGPNRIIDTLFIDLKRIPVLDDKALTLVLKIKSNDNFKVGHNLANEFKLQVSNILLEPKWWEYYKSYFGEFHREVYQKWIQTYEQGLDPTLDVVTGKPYLYWGNMPTYYGGDLGYSFPVLYFYLKKVKKYFQENVVYPDGDSSKSRILLP